MKNKCFSRSNLISLSQEKEIKIVLISACVMFSKFCSKFSKMTSTSENFGELRASLGDFVKFRESSESFPNSAM